MLIVFSEVDVCQTMYPVPGTKTVPGQRNDKSSEKVATVCKRLREVFLEEADPNKYAQITLWIPDAFQVLIMYLNYSGKNKGRGKGVGARQKIER